MNYMVEIQKAIDYIENNLEQDIDYEKVARYVGMSSFYFHRIFSAVVGISPAEYIRKWKAEGDIKRLHPKDDWDMFG